MTVQLGTLKTRNPRPAETFPEVWASDYNADQLWIAAGDPCCQVEINLDRHQLQELSKIIDRFLS